MGNAFCALCEHKTCLKNGKPCKKIEILLRHFSIYSSEYIRPQMSRNKRSGCKWREMPFSYFSEKLMFSIYLKGATNI